MYLGSGISAMNAKAALEGLLGRHRPFALTPKYSVGAATGVRSKKCRAQTDGAARGPVFSALMT